jgi:hypothetical protein
MRSCVRHQFGVGLSHRRKWGPTHSFVSTKLARARSGACRPHTYCNHASHPITPHTRRYMHLTLARPPRFGRPLRTDTHHIEGAVRLTVLDCPDSIRKGMRCELDDTFFRKCTNASNCTGAAEWLVNSGRPSHAGDYRVSAGYGLDSASTLF